MELELDGGATSTEDKAMSEDAPLTQLHSGEKPAAEESGVPQGGSGEVNAPFDPLTELGYIPENWQRFHLRYDPIPGEVLQATVKNSFYYYRYRNFLGTRSRLEDGTLSEEVQWLTFSHVWDLVVRFGSHIRLLYPGSDERPFFGIYSRNCVEWVVSDFSAVGYDYISVPLAHSLEIDQLLYQLNHATVQALLVSEELLPNLLKVIDSCPTLKHVYLVGEVTEETRDAIPEGIAVSSFEDVVRAVEPEECKVFREIEDQDAMMTLLYSSGSTGNPKGAVNTFSRWNNFVTPLYLMAFPLQRLSYAPLAHTTERQLTWLTLVFGGRQIFHSGDMDTIFEEFKVARITQLSAPPRLYDLVYSQYKSALVDAQAASPAASPDDIKREILAEMKGVFGPELQHLIIGGAASSVRVKEFLKECFGCTIYDGYGTTEAGSIASNNVLFPDVEAKLQSVPEMNYTLEDLPYPRGEILVKTKQMIVGYYKDEINTKENFTDGWFRTGDVGEMREGGTIHIIDRCKNVFKNAQGVFVEPSRVENLFLESEFVQQLYVHGQISEVGLVAIAVPSVRAMERLAESLSISYGNLRELYNDSRCRQAVLNDFRRLAPNVGVKPYEVPLNVYLEEVPFSPDNHLMTVSFKPLRRNCAKHYAVQIAALYEEARERKSTIHQDVSGVVSDLFGTTIGGEDDLFAHLGTDSLSSVKLINLVKDTFGKTLSMADIINGEGVTVNDLVDFISNGSTALGQSNRHTLATQDLAGVETFTLSLPATVAQSIEHVLITGATGFLGFHVYLDLLEKHPELHISLLVRCKSPQHGWSRLIGYYKQRFGASLSAEAQSRTTIFAADLSQPLFGLSQEEYDSLAARIDAVVHVGAIVNWLMRYTDIRAVNTLGTISLLRFCATTRVKTFSYVSTISTSSYLEGELLDKTAAFAAGGYALSKWMAELYVRKAATLGLPVIIQKPGMITSHSKNGNCNEGDFTSRYVRALVSIKAFFPSKNILEFMPVDWVASVVIASTFDPLCVGLSLHITNPKSPSSSQIGEWLAQVADLSCIPREEWDANVSRQIDEDTKNGIDSPLKLLFPHFQMDNSMGHYSRVNLDSTIARCESLEDCPVVDSDLLSKMYQYLSRRNRV